ncbi:MAG: hypothetical protein HY695_27015 [Deltaproteobacteria bacterium]|nr:hypothetical protein [Deltaproteobacteria bacterium]
MDYLFDHRPTTETKANPKSSGRPGTPGKFAGTREIVSPFRRLPAFVFLTEIRRKKVPLCNAQTVGGLVVILVALPGT